jgi:hypothetical protein
MNARKGVRAASLPSQPFSQLLERVMHSRFGQCGSRQADKEGRLRFYWNRTLPDYGIAGQCRCNARVQGDKPGFCEFRLTNSQNVAGEIQVCETQLQCLRKPQSGGGDEAKQSLVGCRTKSSLRLELTGCPKQIGNLPIGIDMRCEAPLRPTKDVLLRNVRRPVYSETESNERPDCLQPARPG